MDIVEKLRGCHPSYEWVAGLLNKDAHEVAAEIERLRVQGAALNRTLQHLAGAVDRLHAENERLREACFKAVRFMQCEPLCAAIGGYGYCSCGQQELRATFEAFDRAADSRNSPEAPDTADGKSGAASDG